MRRKILSIVGVAAFTVAVAFNISTNLSNDAEMDVTMANVEALAQGESWISGCFSKCNFDPNWDCITFFLGQPALYCPYMRG